MTNVVSLSGGMDSTAALTQAIRYGAGPTAGERGYPVVAVSFAYGQRHAVELAAAARIAAELRVEHRVLDLRGLLHGSALLGATEVPEGHYAEDTMKATVVNGRNLLFAAALIATTQPGDTITLGVHAGDHPVYPDCRPEFVEHLAGCAAAYDVVVDAPWVHVEKADIIRLVPDAPYALSWSCYQGGEVHCGRCGTCVERAEAFHLAGVEDPTTYADPTFWRETVGA